MGSEERERERERGGGGREGGRESARARERERERGGREVLQWLETCSYIKYPFIYMTVKFSQKSDKIQQHIKISCFINLNIYYVKWQKKYKSLSVQICTLYFFKFVH